LARKARHEERLRFESASEMTRLQADAIGMMWWSGVVEK